MQEHMFLSVRASISASTLFIIFSIRCVSKSEWSFVKHHFSALYAGCWMLCSQLVKSYVAPGPGIGFALVTPLLNYAAAKLDCC